MPHYGYLVYQAERAKTGAERRAADAQLGRLAASLGGLCHALVKPVRALAKPVRALAKPVRALAAGPAQARRPGRRVCPPVVGVSTVAGDCDLALAASLTGRPTPLA
jgi:hypothetical protein